MRCRESSITGTLSTPALFANRHSKRRASPHRIHNRIRATHPRRAHIRAPPAQLPPQMRIRTFGRLTIEPHDLLPRGMRKTSQDAGLRYRRIALVFQDAAHRNVLVPEGTQQQLPGLVLADDPDRQHVDAEVGEICRSRSRRRPAPPCGRDASESARALRAIRGKFRRRRTHRQPGPRAPSP